MLKVREYRKISGSFEPHSLSFVGVVDGRATLFLNKTKSDSGVIPRSAFTRGHLPGEHFDGRRGAVLPSRFCSPSPRGDHRQTRTLVSCNICQTAERGQTERGGVRALVMCGMESLFPLARSLCVVQQKAVVLRTSNNSRRLSYRALPRPPRALPLWKPKTTASSLPPTPRSRP